MNRMSRIHIETTHQLDAGEVRSKLRGAEEELHRRYGIRLDWQGDRAQIRGKGLRGTLVLEEGRARLDLELGLILRPLRASIERALHEQVARALQTEETSR